MEQLPLECPWSPLRVLFGPPNVNWCEASLCGWIEEPANALSNIAYLLTALWILRASRFLSGESKKENTRLAVVVYLMGLCSLVYHASNNFGTQLLDFLGMFLYVSLLGTYNIRRLRGDSASVAGILPWAGLIVLNLCMLFVFPRLGLPIQAIILCNVVFLLVTEAVLWYRTRGSERRGSYGLYGAAMILLAMASAASFLDLRRIACDPHSHFWQGHALWHLLSAFSTGFTAAFYRSLRTEHGIR